MPDSKDLLEQFLDLPSDRQEGLAARLYEALPLPFPSIVRTPNVCGGSARLIRTRIPIWLLQQMRVIGFSDAKLLECYPTLTANDLAQAWAYAAANKAEIDKEIEENEQYSDGAVLFQRELPDFEINT